MGYYNAYQKTAGGNVTYLYYDQSDTGACSLTDYDKRIVYQDISMIGCQTGPNNCNTPIINNGNFICAVNEGWNCNLCPNDLPFWNIVKEDDILNFQFQQLDNLNGQVPVFGGATGSGWFTGLCEFKVYDCCTDTVYAGFTSSMATDWFNGVYNVPDYQGNPFYRNIQSIKISVSQVLSQMSVQFPGIDCFYFEFIFNTQSVTSPPNYVSIFTNPYKLANDCTDTIVIKSDYPFTDCNGYYYGEDIIIYDSYAGAPFPYTNDYRLNAYMEKTGYSISKEFVGVYPKTTSSQRQTNYRFTTNRLAENVADMVSDIFTGQTVYLNDTEFIVDGEINKNNEVGSQWFLEVDMRQIDCSTTFSCDGSTVTTGGGGGGGGVNPGYPIAVNVITCTNSCAVATITCVGPSMQTLYYNSNFAFPGAVLYTSSGLTTPFTGYFKIAQTMYSADPTGTYLEGNIGDPC
jgi:hypothetical protein